VKTLDVAELSRLPEELKSGETIELVDGGKVLATVSPVRELEIPRGTVPDWFFTEPPPKFPGSVLEQLGNRERLVETLSSLNQAGLEARVQELAAQGLVRLGSGEPFPEEFFTGPLPKADGSVLEQLLADREED
jgi:antitoxin (DNA-binding transcriptional repressor) of toxin-antitoxin stability system